MNTRDPDRDVDELLGDDSGKIGKLYKRLPRYEPPRRLDRAVLGEAARAVHSGKSPRRQRWVVGVGSAAGLVLAAGIAWRIGNDAMNRNEATSAGTAPYVVPVQPISEPARGKHEEAPAQPGLATGAADATRADTGAQQSANRASADELKSVHRRATSTSKVVASPAVAEPAPKPASVPPAPPAPQAFPNATRQREQADDLEKSNAGGLAPAESAATSVRSMEKSGPAGAARALSSPTPPSGSVELQRDMQLAPQDWLAHIRELGQQGRRQQATESLRLFQRTHPDWTIPDDLRDLLD